MIFACLKDSTGYQYLKEHANTLAGLLGKIKKKSVSEKFKLKSGETVFVSFTNIGGTFWKVNKEYFGLSTDSNEIDIDSINQIQLCFIPFEINYIQKPKRSGYH